MRKTIIIASITFLVVIFGCVAIATVIFNISAPAKRAVVTQTSSPPPVIVGARNVSTPAPAPIEPVAQPTAVSEAVISQADAEETLLINLYKRVNPSVVNINVVLGSFQHPTLPNGEQPNVPTPEPGGGNEQFSPFFNPQGQGSGFIYSDEGYIITNNHVVEGAKQISVTFFDGTEVGAEVVGTDSNSDLAVLKVDAPTELLVPVSWGDSDTLEVGQRAIAIGNPFGLMGTLTTGVISAKGRSLPALDGFFRIPEIIQTDAAVNPGNSGGPLLDSYGNVIGVVSAIVPRQMGDGERSFLGVGFAIPGNLVKKVVPGLIKNGAYAHPWVGIVGSTLTPEIATEMGLNANQHGAIIAVVYPNSPADKAGLQGGNQQFITREGARTEIGGDVIIAADDEPIATFDDLISFLSRRAEVGQTITLTVIRDGETKTIDLTLEARPSQDELFRQ